MYRSTEYYRKHDYVTLYIDVCVRASSYPNPYKIIVSIKSGIGNIFLINLIFLYNLVRPVRHYGYTVILYQLIRGVV